MSAPIAGVSELALVGGPPEHRDYRDPNQAVWWQPLVKQSALLEAFVTVDCGTGRHTRVGARTWLMKHVHIGHDAIVGDDCELSPGAVVCGWAVLGDGVRMGVNSCVRPFVNVGAGARIGMGAVVVKDVPAGEVWVGNPARKLERAGATGELLTPLEQAGWQQLAERCS